LSPRPPSPPEPPSTFEDWDPIERASAAALWRAALATSTALPPNVAPLARLLRRIDDADPAALVIAEALEADASSTPSYGITGAPGVGKSTLTAALARHLLGRGATVAVLAVDPSSPRSGGALLGDRLRFGDLPEQSGLYLRSLATRGAQGGISRALRSSIAVLGAAGFEVVIVETVGVGQAEIEVAACVDALALVTAPGLGDDIQAMKAGLVELADVLVVNKGDRDGAARAHADLAALGRWLGGRHGATVLTTTATTGMGVGALADGLADAAARRRAGAGEHEVARLRARAAIRSQALAALTDIVERWLDGAGAAQLEAIAAGQQPLGEACRALLRDIGVAAVVPTRAPEA
jgi:LAO/AO transport system kinase